MGSIVRQGLLLEGRLALGLVVLFTGVCLIIYISHTQMVIDGWDPLAYLYAGERLAQGEGFTVCHPYNRSIGPYFALAGFNVRAVDSACLYVKYPPGFPLILAAPQILTGWRDAALYVPAVFGVLGFLATFALGTLLFDRWTGTIGALIVAFAPTYLTFSTSVWADLPGVTLFIAGAAAFLWADRQKGPVGKCFWAVVAGGLVGWSIFTRYANGAILLPLVVYAWASKGRGVFKSANIWVFGVFILLAVIGVLLFNRAYYGGYFTTPYSREYGWYGWPAFSLRYVFGRSPTGGQSSLAVARTTWDNFAWLLPLAGWGIARMCAPQRLLVLGGVLVFAGLYASYAFPAQGINARFLLPAFPFIGLAAGYGLWKAAPERWRWWWRGLGIAVMVLVLCVPLPAHLRGLVGRNASAAAYVDNVARSVERSESDAVFLAYSTNDAIMYHGQRTTLFYRHIPLVDPEAGYRLDVIEDQLVAAVDALLENGVPVYYVQDSDPPFWGSRAILEQHYLLSQAWEEAQIYRVLPAGRPAKELQVED